MTSAAPYPQKGDWIREDLLALIPQPPRRVLSVGCGTCATEGILQERGAEVWGIDFVPESVEAARGKIHRAFLGDIESDELSEIPRAYFDLILCADVLEHLRFPERALARVAEWISPEGFVIASVPNSSNYRALRALFAHRDWKYSDGGLFDRGHTRIFTRKNLLRMIGEAGFAVTSLSMLCSLGGKLRAVAWPLRMAMAIVPATRDYFADHWTVTARRADPGSTPP